MRTPSIDDSEAIKNGPPKVDTDERIAHCAAFNTVHEVDEQALAEALPPSVRAQRGAFFTPSPLVERVLTLIEPLIAQFGAHRPTQFIDPACGAGAFLSAVARRWPQADLLGADLEASSLTTCHARVPRAKLVQANVLTGEVFGPPEGDVVTAWVGNPPYNGTSALLRTPDAWHTARSWLPAGLSLPKGTSLRDDYVFFLLLASKWLEGRDGVLGFITSATLLDAFQYAPVRQALLGRLSLRHVVDLGAGAFRGTKVRTCITVWSTRPCAEPAQFEGQGPCRPRAPDFALRPSDTEAEALDTQWSAEGLPLTTLVPISLPGLKTRFDELLVDDDAGRLLERLRDFVSTHDVEAFARRHGLPMNSWPKLRELHGSVTSIDERKIRPFHRYRGPQPMGPPAFCYLERALIPRGDHRLRGSYDPHGEPFKLIFNVNELPLAAKLISAPGCVTAYRHARFAPLLVPKLILEEGLDCTRRTDALGPLVPNLASPSDDPRLAFERIANFINSPAVQNVWAPAFGTRRILPVPLSVLHSPTGA